jgi:4-amino-4-deoxy-L-arabinose transferase-like glycosyltransferase
MTTTPTHRRWLGFILGAYLILGILYSVFTPPFEASDELWHYPMVKYLAEHGMALPPQDPANPGAWRQEGSQPPLYYMLAAVLAGGIDTGDMDAVRQQNPHADIGVIRPDGNANMMIHTDETSGWRGTLLALQIIRLFSLALGLATVVVTYLLAREIFPEWPIIWLGAAALNAFLPMFLFISGSVNNDNLSNLLGNLLTLLIVRLLKARTLPNWRTYIWIGLVTGAGLLAKLNIGFLIPLVALALLVLSLRLRNVRPVLMGGAITGGLTILIAGWWYWHNYQLYNDPSGLAMFLQMVGRRAIPANAAQLWSERHSFTQAYWGFFGGMNVPLPDQVYLIFNIIGGLALLGAIAFLCKTLVRRTGSLERWLPAAITVIWPVVTFVSFLRWTAETPASQGRLVFGALSALSLWMAVGLLWLLPKRAQPLLMIGIGAYFLLVAALTPFLVIAPAYAAPAELTAATPQSLFRESGGGVVGLLDQRILTGEVQPESYVQIELDWQVMTPLTRDWSLFVHLVTPDGVILGQRDVYPGGGKLATSTLPEKRAWRNPVAIWVPAAAYAPMDLTVVVGWYDLRSGERLTLDNGDETLTIGTIRLQPRPDDLGVPNPIRINFDGQIELAGYSLSDLSPKPGDTVQLTLYWRGLKPIPQDYKVFANILNPITLTKYASSDTMPANWTAPTSTWKPGDIITDEHDLPIDPNAPPGIYELELGFYLPLPEGGYTRLRIITPDGGMANDFTYLSRVRVVLEDAP